jgi:tRNA(fMet)-specific endonuclease VapC
VSVLYLLDTNTCSYIVSGASPAARMSFRKYLADPTVRLCISSITEAEIRYGMAWKELSPQRCAAIESLLECVDVLPWNSATARRYGTSRARLRRKGFAVETMDLLIAIHAAAEDAVLVSHDLIFSKIAEIVELHAVVDWATDIESPKL